MLHLWPEKDQKKKKKNKKKKLHILERPQTQSYRAAVTGMKDGNSTALTFCPCLALFLFKNSVIFLKSITILHYNLICKKQKFVNSKFLNRLQFLEIYFRFSWCFNVPRTSKNECGCALLTSERPQMRRSFRPQETSNLRGERDTLIGFWSPHCGAAEMNLTSIHEDGGSIPGLAQWVK